MDLSFIAEMYIPLVVTACLIIGYILKKWIKDIDNKWIPTICCMAGAALTCLLYQKAELSSIVAGAASGLASTGLHQAFSQLIEQNHQV